jgi:biotin operon repressor
MKTRVPHSVIMDAIHKAIAAGVEDVPSRVEQATQVSRKTVLRVAAANGISLPGPPTVPTMLMIVRQLLETDRNYADIAAEHGVARQYVWKIVEQMKQAGFKTTGKYTFKTYR